MAGDLCSTTTRIYAATGSKLIDYMLVLAHPQDIFRRIQATLMARNEATINNTRAEYQHFHPIAVSLETKGGGGDDEGDKIQVGIWAQAHFSCLRELSGLPMFEGPILPQAIVHSDRSLLKDGQQLTSRRRGEFSIIAPSVSLRRQMTDQVLHGNVEIGDTKRILGIYRLLASLL
jgi:hypothetical protein